jgi:hypothetical protein
MQSNIYNIIIDFFDNIKHFCTLHHNDNEIDNNKLYDANIAIQEAYINTGYEFIWINLPI